MPRWTALFLAVALAGCLHDDRAPRDRTVLGFERGAAEVKAPADRCARHEKSAVRATCDEAKYVSQLYVRRLSPGDQVCLEGGIGETPAAGCACRASVSDVATNRVLVEVREARPESRWFDRIGMEIWFEEGALVDLYLAEHGY